jgi:hypothetical protein
VIFKLSLPSVGEKTLGKELFAECCICDTRQKNSLPSVKNKTLGIVLLRRVFSFTEGFCVALGKEILCRVPEIKHSAKNMTLGKEPNSGSASSDSCSGHLRLLTPILSILFVKTPGVGGLRLPKVLKNMI